MTRQQLTDPFGSDDEEESPPKLSENMTDKIVPRNESMEKIRRDSQVPSLLVIAGSAEEEPEVIKTPKDTKTDDLKERARKLLEQTKRSNEASANASAKSLPRQGSQVSLSYSNGRILRRCLSSLYYCLLYF